LHIKKKKRQEELSRYDPERDLPYDPLQPSIRAPDERIINEDSSTEQIINDKNSSTEYIPSRQHQISGTSYRHDPNIESSTIENLDDDDEDVYDPNKPILLQNIQTQSTNPTAQIPTTISSNTTTSKRTQHDEEPNDASEDDLNKSAIFRSVFHQDNEMDTIPALNDEN